MARRMKHDLIEDEHHVSRYCSPITVDRNGRPMATAFALRNEEESLSVNWIEYFKGLSTEQAIDRIRDAFRKKNYQTRPNGRFALLKVYEVKTVISDLSPSPFKIEHLPEENDPSHSGSFGYTASDEFISLAIKDLVRAEDVYPTESPE